MGGLKLLLVTVDRMYTNFNLLYKNQQCRLQIQGYCMLCLITSECPLLSAHVESVKMGKNDPLCHLFAAPCFVLLVSGLPALIVYGGSSYHLSVDYLFSVEVVGV